MIALKWEQIGTAALPYGTAYPENIREFGSLNEFKRFVYHNF